MEDMLREFLMQRGVGGATEALPPLLAAARAGDVAALDSAAAELCAPDAEAALPVVSDADSVLGGAAASAVAPSPLDAALEAVDGQGQNALLAAASRGHVPAMRWCLGRGARVQVAGRNGLTVLHYAIVRGQPGDGGFELCLAAGADVG